MKQWLHSLLSRRAERREELRKRALMLAMMRELNEMAANGLMAPKGER